MGAKEPTIDATSTAVYVLSGIRSSLQGPISIHRSELDHTLLDTLPIHVGEWHPLFVVVAQSDHLGVHSCFVAWRSPLPATFLALSFWPLCIPIQLSRHPHFQYHYLSKNAPEVDLRDPERMTLSQETVWGIVSLLVGLVGLPASIIAFIEFSRRRHRQRRNEIEHGEGVVQPSSLHGVPVPGGAAASTQESASGCAEQIQRPLQVLLLMGSGILMAPAAPIASITNLSTEPTSTAPVAIALTGGTPSNGAHDHSTSYDPSNEGNLEKPAFDEHGFNHPLDKTMK